MNLASIASGSSGNCIYVGNEKSHFLIDAGISRKRIVEGLSQMEVAPETIQGIFVTHEHIDVYKRQGMNILCAHIDSPRLDLKQNPLYEDTELSFMDTHYYGGIKTVSYTHLDVYKRQVQITP